MMELINTVINLLILVMAVIAYCDNHDQKTSRHDEE
jgi:hypothetical protein